MCPKSKQLKRQRHRKQGAPGGKVYSTESIKTEGEENETEGVERKKAKIPTKGATAKAKKPITVPTRRSARLKMVQPVKYT
jgi:hypothetical protein